MAKIQNFQIDDIANLTQAMLERASKKHKSVNAYCIFVEGDHYHLLVPTYENEAEEMKEIRRIINVFVENPDACKAFAKIIVPPARFHERQAKKARKA